MTETVQASKSTAPRRVLVVDDHRISRQYTVAALRQSGATVKAARNPATALAMALSWRPHVVFVDIELPGTDGYEWMERLRQAWPAGNPPPRLVVLSAHSGGLPVPGPADRVLVKPAAPAQLRAALRTSTEDGIREHHETSPTIRADPAVSRLFRRELADQLRVLDGHFAARGFHRALPILHQLVASCRICGQPRLATKLGALQSLCRESGAGSARAQPGADRLAPLYFEVLAHAGAVLRGSAVRSD